MSNIIVASFVVFFLLLIENNFSIEDLTAGYTVIYKA